MGFTAIIRSQLQRARLSCTALLVVVSAGCTPAGFPESPFVATERDDQIAPDVVPLASGFPGRSDLEQAVEASNDAFSLSEDAAALSTRSSELVERDPAVSGELEAPSPDARETLEREVSLRDRASELRSRDDIGSLAEVEELEARRQRVAEEGEYLRSRTD